VAVSLTFSVCLTHSTACSAYYKPSWANEAWDRHFTGFGRLWITRFPFRVHLTYDDPLPEDPAERRRRAMKRVEEKVEATNEAGRRHLEDQRKSARAADRANTLAAVRAKARASAGTPEVKRSADSMERGEAARSEKGPTDSSGAKANKRGRRRRKKRRGQVGEGRKLLNLVTDSSQDAAMHAIDLRRLVRQNRSPEIARRARIRDRLLALQNRRIRLPKTLRVPVRSHSTGCCTSATLVMCCCLLFLRADFNPGVARQARARVPAQRP